MRSFVWLRLGACVLGAFPAVSSAANVQPDAWVQLRSSAVADGATPVLVDLADVSLVELKYLREKTATRVKAYAESLLGELAEGAWRETVTLQDNGQLSVYLTPQGLDRLKASAIPIAFQHGLEWYQQSRLHRNQIDLEKINQKLRLSGSVEVVVTLNVESLEFEHLENGSLRFIATAAARESRAKRLIELYRRVGVEPNRPAATTIAAELARPNDLPFDPTVVLKVNRRELVAIAGSEAIRDIKLLAPTNGQTEPTFVDPEIAKQLTTQGFATVVIALKSGAPSGNMSPESEEAYWRSTRRTMEGIRSKYGGLAGLSMLPNLSVFVGRISYGEYLSITGALDERIASISMNRDAGEVSLATANPAMGIPSIWNTMTTSGFITGAGATIAILDAGVQTQHDFFKSPNGGSRIVQEACFGTTDSLNISLCPAPQDPAFDSVGPGTGQALFCPNPTINCSHGISVAGIAAGGYFSGSGANAVYSLRSGAYGATIHSYVVASKERTSGGMRMQAVDLLAALSRAVSTLGNASVVNISMSRSQFTYTCDGRSSEVPIAERAIYDAAQSAVNTLFDRGVAVVAATGNNGAPGQIGFPACLSKVVKVGAIPNRANIHNKNSTLTNLPHPNNFGGADYMFMVPGGGAAYGETSTNMSVPVFPNSWNSLGGGGTSWAAPLVSALFALYKSSSNVSSTVAEIGNYLSGAGRTYPVLGENQADGSRFPPNSTYNYKGIRFSAL
jgi:hypothetical protein